MTVRLGFPIPSTNFICLGSLTVILECFCVNKSTKESAVAKRLDQGITTADWQQLTSLHNRIHWMPRKSFSQVLGIRAVWRWVLTVTPWLLSIEYWGLRLGWRQNCRVFGKKERVTMTFDHSLLGKIYERPALLCRPAVERSSIFFFWDNDNSKSLSFLKHATILSLAGP